MSAQQTSGAQRLWGGRFAAEPSVEMDRLNRSLPVDQRLWKEDIAGSRAWAAALGKAGVLSEQEAADLQRGLGLVEQRLAAFTREEWEAP